MAEPRIDARIDYYKPDTTPFAQTRLETPLIGVKLGMVGRDLRIGQRIRVWVGGDPSINKDPAGYDLRLKARIHGLAKEPEVMLVDEDGDKKSQVTYLLPQSALARGRHGICEFGEIAPIKPEQLKVGQVIEGIAPTGDRSAFVVGAIDEETQLPLLETLEEESKRVKLEVKDNGRLWRVGSIRMLTASVRDWTTWVSESAEQGIDPTTANRLNPQAP